MYFVAIQVSISMAGSLMLGYLTEFLIASNNSSRTGLIQSQATAYLFATGIVFLTILAIFSSNLGYHSGYLIGLKIKIIMMVVIYQKVS